MDKKINLAMNLIEQSQYSINQEEQINKPESFHNGYVFKLDYLPSTPDAVLQRDVLTYIQEYRLKVKKSNYELLYTKGDDNKLSLRSNDNGESMLEIGKKAILDRSKYGNSVEKEKADLVGMLKIEDYLKEAKDGESILWASPPDPEVGYEYGFFYLGKVERINEVEKKLNMQAIRLDNNPTNQKFNNALSIFAQKEINQTNVNDFISSPIHLKRSITESEADFVLNGVFDFKTDSLEELRIKNVENKLQPYINTFKDLVQNGASQHMLRRMMFAIENYSLLLNRQKLDEGVIYESIKPLKHLLNQYSFNPPIIIGSCDTSLSINSPNIFGYGSIFYESSTLTPWAVNEKNWSYTLGECVLCEDKHTQVGPCKICKTCEKKFD